MSKVQVGIQAFSVCNTSFQLEIYLDPFFTFGGEGGSLPSLSAAAVFEGGALQSMTLRMNWKYSAENWFRWWRNLTFLLLVGLGVGGGHLEGGRRRGGRQVKGFHLLLQTHHLVVVASVEKHVGVPPPLLFPVRHPLHQVVENL